jgi:glucokinase
MKRRDRLILAGDIGGTKTGLALFSFGPDIGPPMVEETFASRDYPSLEALIREFLSGAGRPVHYAGFGVAGPVVDGKAQITNLPWVVDEAKLAAEFGFGHVRLFNDLEAIAAAVAQLGAGDFYTLNSGRAIPGGTIALLAPGTGLGEAYLVWDGTRYRSYPSEGGHADFAPVDAQQTGLLLHLLERFEHVSYERVCSGIGLPNIYAYLKESGVAQEPDWLREKLNSVTDPVPLIVKAAFGEERECKLCRAALEMFISILGAAAGNSALKLLATGGIYLGGGIPPRILPALRNGLFMDAFRRKGRMSGLMEDIPVHVIIDPKAAVLGAARLVLDRHRPTETDR